MSWVKSWRRLIRAVDWGLLVLVRAPMRRTPLMVMVSKSLHSHFHGCDLFFPSYVVSWCAWTAGHLSLDLIIIMKVNMSFLTFHPLRTTSLAVDLLVPAASATSIQPECTAERVAEIRSTLLLLYGEHRWVDTHIRCFSFCVSPINLYPIIF